MKSMREVNLDTYSLSLLTAKEDILNPRSSTNWALFAYDGIMNRLKLADSGVGGLKELTSKLHPRRPLYGMCRVGAAQPRIVMILWVGNEVDEFRRAECASHIPAIRAFFKEVHIFLPAHTLDEITEERICSLVCNTAVGPQGPRARPSRRLEDRHTAVGTNYQRTNAAAEIYRIQRDSFWAQAEREEEERKKEEQRRAAEDRRQRERERLLQEKREAMERERRMNEKEQKIKEQRRMQAQMEAETHKQEKMKWRHQQKEREEEETRARHSLSESEHKAAEAAALVSQRVENPREFFRQLSSSRIQTASLPISPSSVRSSYRRLNYSQTDSILSFVGSPSPTPTSPNRAFSYFPSSPTNPSPTVFTKLTVSTLHNGPTVSPKTQEQISLPEPMELVAISDLPRLQTPPLPPPELEIKSPISAILDSLVFYPPLPGAEQLQPDEPEIEEKFPPPPPGFEDLPESPVEQPESTVDPMPAFPCAFMSEPPSRPLPALPVVPQILTDLESERDFAVRASVISTVEEEEEEVDEEREVKDTHGKDGQEMGQEEGKSGGEEVEKLDGIIMENYKSENEFNHEIMGKCEKSGIDGDGRILEESEKEDKQDGNIMEEHESGDDDVGKIVEEFESNKEEDRKMLEECESEDKQDGNVMEELENDRGEKNVDEFVNIREKDGIIFEECKSEEKQDGNIMEELESKEKQDGNIMEELESEKEVGKTVEESENIKEGDGKMLEEYESANDRVEKTLDEFESISEKDEDNFEECKSEEKQNGDIMEELKSEKDRVGKAVEEFENIKEDENIFAECQSEEKQDRHNMEKLESEKESLEKTVEEFESITEEYRKMLKEFESEDKQDGKFMEELESENDRVENTGDESESIKEKDGEIFEECKSEEKEDEDIMEEHECEKGRKTVEESKSITEGDERKTEEFNSEEAQVGNIVEKGDNEDTLRELAEEFESDKEEAGRMLEAGESDEHQFENIMEKCESKGNEVMENFEEFDIEKKQLVMENNQNRGITEKHDKDEKGEEESENEKIIEEHEKDEKHVDAFDSEKEQDGNMDFRSETEKIQYNVMEECLQENVQYEKELEKWEEEYESEKEVEVEKTEDGDIMEENWSENVQDQTMMKDSESDQIPNASIILGYIRENEHDGVIMEAFDNEKEQDEKSTEVKEDGIAVEKCEVENESEKERYEITEECETEKMQHGSIMEENDSEKVQDWKIMEVYETETIQYEKNEQDGMMVEKCEDEDQEQGGEIVENVMEENGSEEKQDVKIVDVSDSVKKQDKRNMETFETEKIQHMESIDECGQENKKDGKCVDKCEEEREHEKEKNEDILAKQEGEIKKEQIWKMIDDNDSGKIQYGDGTEEYKNNKDVFETECVNIIEKYGQDNQKIVGKSEEEHECEKEQDRKIIQMHDSENDRRPEEQEVETEKTQNANIMFEHMTKNDCSNEERYEIGKSLDHESEKPQYEDHGSVKNQDDMAEKHHKQQYTEGMSSVDVDKEVNVHVLREESYTEIVQRDVKTERVEEVKSHEQTEETKAETPFSQHAPPIPESLATEPSQYNHINTSVPECISNTEEKNLSIVQVESDPSNLTDFDSKKIPDVTSTQPAVEQSPKTETPVTDDTEMSKEVKSMERSNNLTEGINTESDTSSPVSESQARIGPDEGEGRVPGSQFLEEPEPAVDIKEGIGYPPVEDGEDATALITLDTDVEHNSKHFSEPDEVNEDKKHEFLQNCKSVMETPSDVNDKTASEK